jgi:hypothetical protein
MSLMSYAMLTGRCFARSDPLGSTSGSARSTSTPLGVSDPETLVVDHPPATARLGMKPGRGSPC